jgi:hypothetical protein
MTGLAAREEQPKAWLGLEVMHIRQRLRGHHRIGANLSLHAGAALLALLVTTMLAVYKPRA